MRFVKLDATDSTNDYLKEMARSEPVENFTVVTARKQTRGRGQMGATWISEEGKNLTMSMLVRDQESAVNTIFKRNAAVAIAISDVLKAAGIPGLSVKWPNDIMSGNKKIGGILIENSFKNDGTIESIVGVGLNVNQIHFEGLPYASSLRAITDEAFDLDQLATDIALSIRSGMHRSDEAWNKYLGSLFRKNLPTAFRDATGVEFMGIIKGVGDDGRLQVLLEDESVRAFGIKEIQMLY